MALPHVLILHNAPLLPLDHPERESEADVLHTAAAIRQALVGADYRTSQLGVTYDLEPLLQALRKDRPDVIVNLFEGFGDRSDTEVSLAGLLEWLQIPFTGSSAQTLAVARNKPLAKRVLLGGNLPTAEFFEVHRPPAPHNPLGWPVMVKPACEDASLGIDQGSVVRTQEALEQRVQFLLARFDPPVLVERFLPGREFHVPVVETPNLQALPASEIIFQPDPAGRTWPILTYAAKWDERSPEYQHMDRLVQTQIAPPLRATLHQLALQAYTLLGMRDYGRIDFRVLPTGECFILEGNPNPDSSPTSCLASGLQALGLTYDAWVRSLVRSALGRTPSRRSSG